MDKVFEFNGVYWIGKKEALENAIDLFQVEDLNECYRYLHECCRGPYGLCTEAEDDLKVIGGCRAIFV